MASKRILIYTIAFDAPGSATCRQMARLLVASLVRTGFDGECAIMRNTMDPIFLIPRVGIQEIFVETEPLCDQALADEAKRWKFRAREVLDIQRFDVIAFLDVDCLALRKVDVLFEADDWDILFQREAGRGIQDDVFSSYLTRQEMESLNCDGVNSGTWATRATVYPAIMEEWERISERAPMRDLPWRDQPGWNRLLLDSSRHGWQLRPFTEGAIKFPLHLDRDKDWLCYRESVILHCLGARDVDKLQFMYGIYMQTFFHDPQGTIPNLLDM